MSDQPARKEHGPNCNAYVGGGECNCGFNPPPPQEQTKGCFSASDYENTLCENCGHLKKEHIVVCPTSPAPRPANEREAGLLPCPFCGSGNISLNLPTCRPETPYNPTDRLFPWVSCRKCHAEVPGNNEDYKGRSAVEAWNHRTTQSSARVEPTGAALSEEEVREIILDIIDCVTPRTADVDVLRIRRIINAALAPRKNTP